MYYIKTQNPVASKNTILFHFVIYCSNTRIIPHTIYNIIQQYTTHNIQHTIHHINIHPPVNASRNIILFPNNSLSAVLMVYLVLWSLILKTADTIFITEVCWYIAIDSEDKENVVQHIIARHHCLHCFSFIPNGLCHARPYFPCEPPHCTSAGGVSPENGAGGHIHTPNNVQCQQSWKMSRICHRYNGHVTDMSRICPCKNIVELGWKASAETVLDTRSSHQFLNKWLLTTVLHQTTSDL